MKKKQIFTFASVLVILFTGSAASAQDEIKNNGWIVSGAAGFNSTYDASHHGYGTAVDLSFGKWLSPAVGLRAGWNGLFSGLDQGHVYNQ